jgi:uncharacterized protein YfaS (alpha-2-macroglobulin family)
MVFLGGALSDSGKGYEQSSIYIQSSNKSEKILLGNIGIIERTSEESLCLALKPGTYTLRIENSNAVPAVIERTIKVNAQQTYIYALDTNAPSWKAGTVSLETISLRTR